MKSEMSMSPPLLPKEQFELKRDVQASGIGGMAREICPTNACRGALNCRTFNQLHFIHAHLFVVDCD